MIKIPKLQILSVLVVAAALMALMVVPVLAQIPVFSGFSGSVNIDTAPAPVGSQLRAYVDGALAELPPPAVGNVYTLTTAGFYEIVIQTDDTDQAVTFEVKAAGGTQWFPATPTPASPVTSYQPQVVNLEAYTGVVPVPDISVSTTLVAFGSVDVGTSDTETVTVSNVGNANLSITMAITGTNANQFSVAPTSQTISPAGSYGLVVTFSPTSTGAKSATLTITSNDPDEPTVNVALSGTGGGPPPESFRSWLYETFVECLLD